MDLCLFLSSRGRSEYWIINTKRIYILAPKQKLNDTLHSLIKLCLIQDLKIYGVGLDLSAEGVLTKNMD